jgi:hypothetical protein
MVHTIFPSRVQIQPSPVCIIIRCRALRVESDESDDVLKNAVSELYSYTISHIFLRVI